MTTLRCALISLTASLLAAGSLQAAMLNVTNNSFEQSTGYNGGNPTAVPGWPLVAPNGGTYGQVAVVTSFFTSGLSGTNAIYVNGQLGQQTASTFQMGASYTFTLDVGNPNNAAPLDNNAGFSFGFRNSANSDFIQAAGGFRFVLASEVNAVPDGTFQTFSVTYTATAADNGNPVIIFIDDYYSNGTPNFYLDNATLNTTASAVPEPSTYAGVFVGLLALAGARRRMQRPA